MKFFAKEDAALEVAASKISILLIEDNAADVEIFKKVIERAADANLYRIESAKTLAKAQKLIEKEKFTVIILDLHLPDGKGLETIEFLKSLGIEIPIIVMTGMDDGKIGIEAVRQGAQEYIVKGSINGNLLSDSIKHAIERHKIVYGLEKEKDQHQYFADHDHLTNLPNRKLLYAHFELAIAQAQRTSKSLAVLFLDIDDFKLTNDTYGHVVGDQLLKSLASRLTGCLRAGDMAARLGGDEFMVVLSNVESPRAAGIAAERILDSISQMYEIDKFKINPTFSIGISLFPQDDGSADGLVSAADVAMLQAKQLGKNQYGFFSPQINVKAQEIKELESQLMTAFKNGEFDIHYQPEYQLSDKSVTSVQALIRWKHPELGLVPAKHFIPFIEQNEFLLTLNSWILEKTAEQIKNWKKLKGISIPVSLNLAPAAFRNEDFIKNFEATLKKYKIDGSEFRLEMREADILNYREKALTFLNSLSALGIQLVLDGFGVGISSITQLEKLPLNAVKIDRSLIHKCEDPQTKSMIKAIVDIAHGFRLVAIGEGVETESQLEILKTLNCDRVQGFFLNKPLPAEQMMIILSSKIHI
ncbi:MAG: EAL domain-containing protein [Deltaproteobacteria bacterium]|nr:EAL domain-containing protein [Deltaproteobacteria bacterium]